MIGDLGPMAVPKPIACPSTTLDPQPGKWALSTVAQVVSSLLGHSLEIEEVRERALALGLVRQPASGDAWEMSGKSVARLLISGFRLPAHVEVGSIARLTFHRANGRRVLVVLDAGEIQPSSAEPPNSMPHPFLVKEITGRFSQSSVRLRIGDANGTYTLPFQQFSAAWESAGNLQVVAARNWTELPRKGKVFFGGWRDFDGAFHWETAACDTDAGGNVLRF